MPSIVDLQNRIVALEGELSSITSAGEVSPEDAVRAAGIDGRLAEARDQLVAEAARVQAENERLAAEASAHAGEVAHDLAAALFGPAGAFNGIAEGWRASVPAALARQAGYAARNAVSGLTTPQIYSTELPQTFAPPMGFLDTIAQGTTDGDEHYFQAPTFTNAAAGWTSGNKPESGLAWTQATALLEVIAHYMPIEKQTARRYRTLESTVANTLMLGLEMKKDAFAVAGSNSSGIVGALNQAGVQTYTQQTSGTMADTNLYDIAVEMSRLVRVNSGLPATHFAAPSSLLTTLRKAKGNDGHYLYPEIVNDGKLNGLPIVEDENLSVTTTSNGATTTRNYVGCYFGGAATWNVADPDEVTVGLIGNQFIQNAYTLLAEGTYSLKVPFPKAFCFCEVSL